MQRAAALAEKEGSNQKQKTQSRADGDPSIFMDHRGKGDADEENGQPAYQEQQENQGVMQLGYRSERRYIFEFRFGHFILHVIEAFFR
jgi:hypothetical protein